MFTPGSFDPTSDLAPIEQPSSWRWSSLEAALLRAKPTVAMMRLPLFWQMLSPAHAACASTPCGFFVNDKDNMPLGEAATRVGAVDFVITCASDAAAFSLYLAEKNATLKHWFVVYEPAESWDVAIGMSDADVTQEVHLTPGVPLLIQCDVLSAKKNGMFHWAEGVSTDRMNALRIELEEQASCACGKQIVRKK